MGSYVTAARSRVFFHKYAAAFCTVTIASMIVCAASAQGPQELISIKSEIETAWLRRHNEYSEFIVEWRFERFLPKGSVEPPFDGKPLPQEDVTYHGHCKLVVGRNGLIRYETDGPWLFFNTGTFDGFQDLKDTSTFDGVHRMNLKIPADDRMYNEMGPTGLIIASENNHSAKLTPVQVMLLLFQPMSSQLSGDWLISNYTPVGRASVNDRECLLLEYTHDAFANELYVELIPPFRVIRHELYTASDRLPHTARGDAAALSPSLTFQVDFVPSKTGDGIGEWTYHARAKSSGELLEVLKAYDLVARAERFADTSVFRIDFPVGTFVHDRTDGSSFYIEQEDGNRRPVLEEEMIAKIPYHILLSTQPGEAIGKRGTPMATPLAVIGISILIVVVLIARLWRRAARVPKGI